MIVKWNVKNLSINQSLYEEGRQTKKKFFSDSQEVSKALTQLMQFLAYFLL